MRTGTFSFLAERSGGTVWGPCTDGTKLECDCPQCLHANSLDAQGLDWDEEFQKAEARDFDRSEED